MTWEPDAAWKWENLGKITSGIAHDFNNVLATISGFAELILSDQGGAAGAREPAATGFARYILQAAAAGQSTVRELQEMVKPAGLRREDLDLHELLANAAHLVRGTLRGSISIDCEFAGGPARVHGSRGLLQNVFINLMINARDALPQGGRIQVRVAARSGAAEILVKDDGVGMSEEIQARIFEPFFTTKGSRGNGLGLANVLNTVEDHGGSIAVRSQPGQGTEFRITLPLRGEFAA